MEDGNAAKASADQRKKALRKLARDVGRSQPSDTPDIERDIERSGGNEKIRRNREPKRWLRMVAALAMVAVLVSIVAGVLIHLQQKPTTAHSIAPITPRLNGLDCAQDVAWSPDGTRIAIVGYQNACGQDDVGAYASVPGWVTIYNVSARRLLASFSPDSAIDHAPGVSAPTIATPQASGSDVTHPAINYQHLLWSPDGQSLALTFEVNEWASTVRPSRLYGVAIINSASGTSSYVFTHIATASDPAYLEWDLMAGKLLSTAQTTQTTLSNLPGGQVFTWGADGAITATASSQGFTAPIGQPDGTTSFSVWQPGQAAMNQLDGSESPTVCTWQSSFAAWSPDSRYLIATALAGGIIDANGCLMPTSAQLENTGYAGSPTLAPHDSAIASVYADIEKAPGVPQTTGQTVAWRPSGTAMATIPTYEPSATPAARTVTVYNTATGQVIAKLTPQANTQYAFDRQQTPILRWSPDGSRLLLLDSQLGVVTIWDKSNGLPA